VTSAHGGPLLTGVVRCNPVVRGPDVAPTWPHRSARVTPSLPFLSSLPYREAVQVKVTRMTVADREEPRAPVRYGTRVARPVRMTAASPGGDGTSSGDKQGSSRATQASLASPREGATALKLAEGSAALDDHVPISAGGRIHADGEGSAAAWSVAPSQHHGLYRWVPDVLRRGAHRVHSSGPRPCSRSAGDPVGAAVVAAGRGGRVVGLPCWPHRATARVHGGAATAVEAGTPIGLNGVLPAEDGRRRRPPAGPAL
jgi:hypothetical protein